MLEINYNLLNKNIVSIMTHLKKEQGERKRERNLFKAS